MKMEFDIGPQLFPRPILFGISLALMVTYVSTQGTVIGKSCNIWSNCTSEVDGAIDCINDVCQCKPGIEIHYDINMELTCMSDHDKINQGLTCSKNKTCGKNAECRKVKHSEPPLRLCHCTKGYFRVRGKCKQASFKNPLESCGAYAKSVSACDISKHSVCLNGHCVCFEPYYLRKGSWKCEPMVDYLIDNGLSEYRVKPKEYCLQDFHCISGLECENFQCKCPEPCSYREYEEVCYCGRYTVIGKTGPLILGIILGVMIFTFWAWRIRTLLERYGWYDRKNKRNRAVTSPPPNYREVADNCEIPSDRISCAPPPIELTFNSGAPEEQSGTLDGATHPGQPESGTSDTHPSSHIPSDVILNQPQEPFNPLFPCQGSSYYFNQSHPPTPSAPPKDTEESRDLDLPPPYYSLYPLSTDVIVHSVPDSFKPSDET